MMDSLTNTMEKTILEETNPMLVGTGRQKIYIDQSHVLLVLDRVVLRVISFMHRFSGGQC